MATSDLIFNTDYINRTPNKEAIVLGSNPRYADFVVMHETASPNPNNPHGTLRYNLNASVRAAYDFLVAQDGTIYQYVNRKKYYTWHAGVNSRWYVRGRWLQGGAINRWAIGVEIDGKNNGEPISRRAFLAAVRLIRWLETEFGIPIDAAYYPGHDQVAPGYKKDPEGFSVAELLQAAREESMSTKVIGVAPRTSEAQFLGSLVRNNAPLQGTEARRIFRNLVEYDMEPSFFLGTWALMEFGRLEPLRSARSPWPLWLDGPMDRPIVAELETPPQLWKFQSWQIGCNECILDLKNTLAWSKEADTVEEIVPRILAGRDALSTIQAIKQHMAYIQAS